MKIVFITAISLIYSTQILAEWQSSLSTGLNYSNNYSLQNANYNNISQSQTSRTGSDVSGTVNWESLGQQGGYSVDASFLVDKDTNVDQKISSLNTSVNKVSSINDIWLSRYTFGLPQYLDESYTANSFTGNFLEATFGYFANNQNGYDISLSYNNEDHNQAINDTYKNQKYGLRLVKYSPNYINIMGGIQRLQSTDSRRNTTSYLANIRKSNIKLLSTFFAISANIKIDSYDEAYTSSSTTSNQNSGSSSNMWWQSNNNNSGNNSTSAQKRTDSQYYLSINMSRPLSKQLSFQVSSNVGSYNSVTGDQTFFNLYSRLRWKI